MGMVPIAAELVAGLIFDMDISGRCLQLGRQRIAFDQQQLITILNNLKNNNSRSNIVTNAFNRLDQIALTTGDQTEISDEVFFHTLGFNEILSVDVSDYEDAQILHDLNTPGLQHKLPGPVDFAIESGTAEHIFHVPIYLQNVCESLAVGGVVVHISPVHGYIDHGFYQFSPTLFYDFYLANRFKILDLVLIYTDSDDWRTWNIHRYDPGEYINLDRTRFTSKFVLLAVAAKKQDKSTSYVVPQQSTYRQMSKWTQQDDQTTIEISDSDKLGILHPPFKRFSQSCWLAEIPENIKVHGDSIDNGQRSRLLVLENCDPLGPGHSLIEKIQSEGRGCYSHWGNKLYFSSSDNSDPNYNNRVYELRLLPGIEEYFHFDNSDKTSNKKYNIKKVINAGLQFMKGRP